MAVDPFNNFECGSEAAGSIIGCEDQTLGEIFPIGGTPHALHRRRGASSSEERRGLQ